jgi:hypothetical protein
LRVLLAPLHQPDIHFAACPLQYLGWCHPLSSDEMLHVNSLVASPSRLSFQPK